MITSLRLIMKLDILFQTEEILTVQKDMFLKLGLECPTPNCEANTTAFDFDHQRICFECLQKILGGRESN